MTGNTVVSQSNRRILVAWLLLLAIWLATPFMGDRIPLWVGWTYGVGTIAGSVFGLYVAWRQRRIVLAIVSVLTLFAWPILLVIGLVLFGI